MPSLATEFELSHPGGDTAAFGPELARRFSTKHSGRGVNLLTLFRVTLARRYLFLTWPTEGRARPGRFLDEMQLASSVPSRQRAACGPAVTVGRWGSGPPVAGWAEKATSATLPKVTVRSSATAIGSYELRSEKRSRGLV